MRARWLIVALAGLATGCGYNRAATAFALPGYAPRAPLTPGGFTVVDQHAAPVEYRSPTFHDVDKVVVSRLLGPVESESCEWSVGIPVAPSWPAMRNGDSSYQRVVALAFEKSGAQMLYDVKTDRRLYGIVSIFWRSCTQLHAQAAMVDR